MNTTPKLFYETPFVEANIHDIKSKPHADLVDRLRESQFKAIKKVTVAHNHPSHWGEDDWNEVYTEEDVMGTLQTLDTGLDFEVWVVVEEEVLYTRPIQG